MSVLCFLKTCVKDLKSRVSALEGAASSDTDDQVISLSGNVLTLSGGLVSDSTVNLSGYLDNSDDQSITNFAVVGSNVVLSIESGNTVTVPLSDFQDGTGTDDQTISLIGNVLSIQDGNSVNLSAYLDNTDSQVLSTTVVGGETTSIQISGGNSVPILHNHPAQTLNTTTAVIRSEEYFAKTVNGTTQSGVRNMTITRTAVGQWTAALSPTHPDGVDYHVSLTAEEQSANRDTPDITIVQGSQTAGGFQFQITTGDNGTGADVYIDTPFTIGIDAPVTVLTGASLV